MADRQTGRYANRISGGSGEGWGRRRKRSRATGNEEKEMRWSTTSQGVVTGSGPSACPKEAKRLNRGLWEAWHAKPLLLSASKKNPIPHLRQKFERKTAGQVWWNISETQKQTSPDADLPWHLAHISRRRWRGSLAGVLELEVTRYDSDARGNRSVLLRE